MRLGYHVIDIESVDHNSNTVIIRCACGKLLSFDKDVKLQVVLDMIDA